MAGQRLLEAMIIYFKLNTKGILSSKADSKNDGSRLNTAIKVTDLENELKENKELIKMTAGYADEEEDEGSDSEPSGDNLDEEELAQLVPIEKKPEEVKNPNPKKPDSSKTKIEDVKTNSA